MLHSAKPAALLVAVVPMVAALAQEPIHWAYRSPPPVEVPAVVDSAWCRSPVDAFVRARMQRANRVPAAEADRRTLARRLAFDLTGLPPKPQLVQAFASGDATAYEALVDDLLASRHFAERMAMHWLDLVRYADSTGIHADSPWDVHPYRDWVLAAFDRNMPFDQFTREQIAGDLIPHATTDQKVAAAYNRLNMVTREGGSQAKEFLARYMADRVRNVSTVWLASTVGCAECHDHKFDPIPARDFYRLGAFFADIQQVGVYSNGAPKNRYFGPYLQVPTDAQKADLTALDEQIAEAMQLRDVDRDELAAAQSAWEDEVRDNPPTAPKLSVWHAAGPFTGGDLGRVHRTAFGPESGLDLAREPAEGISWVKHPEWRDNKVHALKGARSAHYLFRTIEVGRAQRMTLWFGSDDAIRVWVDGELRLDRLVSRGVAPDQERLEVDLDAGRHELLVKVSNGAGGYAFYFRGESREIPEGVRQVLGVPRAKRDRAELERVAAYFRSVTPLLVEQRAAVTKLQKQREALVDAVPVCIATVAAPPMTTRVLRRGDWMDDSGEVVAPGVPSAFGSFSSRGDRATRLDLAEWLVDGDNPLVARVFVNRLWYLFFGRGIAPSLGDFGTQGEPPTHPQLLDWLAQRFVASGWDVKAMVRLLVLSSTYRQSSMCSIETAREDPYNSWFTRQARFRLDAEFVRDNALSVSGLLVAEFGGRSVRPYQPAGFYQHLNFPKRRYQQDAGRALWRRSVYTHWQRQYLHPALAAFDAPSREACTVQRPRSNTPLQALVLLNDPIMVEAARALASRALRAVGGDDVARLRWAFREVLQRQPTADEVVVLRRQLAQLQQQYAGDLEAAAALVAIGESGFPDGLGIADLAAWTGIARVMLSLHETLTRY
ncbi:MAG: DUF1549 and DUF1553 domain-containing protein [Planctomycetota bacterium]